MENLAHQDHPDKLENEESQDTQVPVEMKAHEVPQDQLERMELMVPQDHEDPQDHPD